MKILHIIFAALICSPMLATGVPDSVITGPYNISFDLGFSKDSYRVNIADPIQKEELNGDVTTEYNVSIQNITEPDRKIKVELTEYGEDHIIPTAEELKEQYALILSIAGNVKKSEVDTRVIDGVKGVILSATPKADKSRGITEKESFVAEWNPSNQLNILLDLDFPWEEGTLSMLKTIHIEKINETS